MAVLSSRAYERQSPRGFSALARLYYLARPTKTAMLRRLPSVESLWSSLQGEEYFMGGGAAGGLWRHQQLSQS